MVRAQLKWCDHCGLPYLYGKGECARARYKYCSAACAAAARKIQNKLHHDAYYGTDEGRAQHADEERRRRTRQRAGVGAQSGKAEETVVKVAGMKPPQRRCAAPAEEPVEWLVEVLPAEARKARRLCARRQELRCVVCGVRGYVAQVAVVKPQAALGRPGAQRWPRRKQE